MLTRFIPPQTTRPFQEMLQGQALAEGTAHGKPHTIFHPNVYRLKEGYHGGDNR